MTAPGPYVSLLAGAGLSGAVVTQLLSARNVVLRADALSGNNLDSFALARAIAGEALSWSNWDSFTLAGAIAGMLVAHAAFILKDPKRRLSLAIVICVLGNVAAWLVFLPFGERVTEAEFARSAVERARLDAGTGGLSILHDAPTVVACRWVGTFGAVNFADRLLTLFAGPAIGFSQAVAWPEASSAAEGVIATPGESWKVAATAFFLSTTFWVAVGSVVSAARRRRIARLLSSKEPHAP